MNVISPLDTSHTITIVPRFEPVGTLVFTLKDTDRDENTDLPNVYLYSDGKLSINFDLDTTEDYNYKIKVSDDTRVIYRGSIFATSQTPQNYKMLS